MMRDAQHIHDQSQGMSVREEITNAAGSGNLMNDRLKSAKTIALVVYALQAMSFFLIVTMVVAIIINYVKLDDVKGTWVESHFRWQIRTFWFGLLWSSIGYLTLFIGIGFFILLAVAIWLIYRIVRGWLRLNDNKPIGVPA